MEFLFLDHCAQVKGQISGMKAKVLSEGTEIDPDQLLKQAEDEIHMEMVASEVAKTKEVLNNSGDWLNVHPLEVNNFDTSQFQRISLSSLSKGRIISKRLMVSSNSSRIFVSKMFVRFLEEFEDIQKAF
jgi:hypothetical protein